MNVEYSNSRQRLLLLLLSLPISSIGFHEAEENVRNREREELNANEKRLTRKIGGRGVESG
jgi:hypothetical protein